TTLTVAKPETAPLTARTTFAYAPGAVPAVNRPVPLLMTPAVAFTTDQTGFITKTLPLASFPTARNCCTALVSMNTGFGVTVMLASGPLVTMTVAKPASPPLLARTVLANVPDTVPAVKRPVALMAPPFATTAHTGVIATGFPAMSLPAAVNCWVALSVMVAGVGVTVMVASGPAVTTTGAVAESKPPVALTGMLKVPGAAPAVKRPPPSTVPPPATTDHVAAIAIVLPPASLPVATNCCLAPTFSVSGLGVTVRLASGPAVTVTVAKAVMP